MQKLGKIGPLRENLEEKLETGFKSLKFYDSRKETGLVRSSEALRNIM